MNPTRILPDLQCSVLCEDVRQEANGNFFLIGVMSFLRTPQVPITAFKLAVFTRWTAGVGTFVQNVRLIAPDQSTVMRESKVQFTLQDPAHSASNLSMFAQVEFKTAGVYYVEVLVDDVMKLRFPVPLVVVQPPGGQPGQAPQPPKSE
ncbi:MAG: hypothetical protein AB1705_07525 [Verrucomicrobiota bacterium]